MANAAKVLATLNAYNEIPMRGNFSFVYENRQFAAKGLTKVTAFVCMKIKDIVLSKKGSMVFEALVLNKSQSGYLYKGKPVTSKEWFAIAGIPETENKEDLPTLHFRVDNCSDLK